MIYKLGGSTLGHMDKLQLSWIKTQLASHEPVSLSLPDPFNRASVAAILKEDNEDGCQLLFIRRSVQKEDPWSGHMAFPGGRVETDDSNRLAAAKRETQEEVGIDLDQNGILLGQLNDVPAMARGKIVPLVVTPFIFVLKDDQNTILNEEVQEVHWIPIKKLLDPSISSTIPYDIQGETHQLPCLLVRGLAGINDRVIWGLTYMMLRQFFSVLQLNLP